MKNKRGKLITVLFVAAMSVSLFTGCSDDATITIYGLDEGVHCLNWHPTQKDCYR